MSISYDLIKEFVTVTNDNKKEIKDTTTYGIIVMYGNKPYVKIDGSEMITPCTCMIGVEEGDRVAVEIKNHEAYVTGDISNPSPTKKSVDDLNVITTDKLEADDIEAINGYFQQLTAICGRYDELTVGIAKIDELKATYGNFDRINTNDIKAINAEIDNLKTLMISAQGITTEDLNATNAQIDNLKAYNASFGYLSAEELRAIKANIKTLDVTKLSAESADLRYANIGFTNIQIAAIETLFSESGIIKDITTQSGKITGELVGVTIKGDLIEGSTITADKLVIKGEDGVYYKLNIDGLNNISTTYASKFEAVQTEPDDWETNYKDYYSISNNKYIHPVSDDPPEWNPNIYYKLTAIHESGLDGTNIIAQTITADKISVTDLVAFGATIGGFHITNNSIYSGAKNSVSNTTRGLYIDSIGQLSLGDNNSFIKYYYDEIENKWKLNIQVNDFTLTSINKTLEEALEEIEEKTTVNLVIESSRGTVFKNNQASTVLSVIIYRGNQRITNMNDLRSAMGNNVYLQWKWRRITDNDYGIISSSDSHLSENGFKYTISPADVDNQVTYMCELINS